MIAVFDIIYKGKVLNKPIAVELNGHKPEDLKDFVFLSWLVDFKGNVFDDYVKVIE